MASRFTLERLKGTQTAEQHEATLVKSSNINKAEAFGSGVRPGGGLHPGNITFCSQVVCEYAVSSLQLETRDGKKQMRC